MATIEHVLSDYVSNARLGAAFLKLVTKSRDWETKKI
jgi:hypothetical protein